MPITFAEWRKERQQAKEGYAQVLLSGLEVRLRPVDPVELLRGGNVPDILTPLVLKSLYHNVREDVDNYVFTPREQAKEALQMVDSVNVVCEAALVFPRIVANPQAEGEIAVGELSLADRMWIFKLAFMPAELLSTFHYEPSGDVEAVADGQIDTQPTEPIAERQG